MCNGNYALFFFFFLVVKGQYYIFEVRASISKITIAHQGTRMCSASEVSVLSCVLVGILSGLSLEVALSCIDHDRAQSVL